MECRKLHPEEGSRTAAHDSCGYTYDVSCTYRSSERCCQSTEAGYVSLCAFFVVNGVSEGEAEPSLWVELGFNGQENTYNDDENHHYGAPYKTV